MRVHFMLAASFAIVVCPLKPLLSQDLAPRAYIIAPVHSNAVTLTYSFLNGDIVFDNTLPIENADGRISISTLSLYHTLNFLGRSANVTASLPYAVGNFRATVIGTETNAYRSGLLPASFRFSVNLKGGPAMTVKEFLSWRQKTIIGASLKILPPTGQYDPTRLINPGTNRWAFKPELGLSRRWGQWVVDTYGAVWFFTTNSDFFSRNQISPGTNTQSQSPIGAFEGHLSYDVKKGGLRSWISLDGNFWYGGRTSLNGVENPATLQANSRVGATASVPVNKHQSLKFSYSYGAIARYGGSSQNVSVAWQYSWLGRPN
jgi:hypothetical protein